MKIGILTLHSQTNYGGVLQAYALQQVLIGLGHQVCIIDRRMDGNRCPIKSIIKSCIRALLGCGDCCHFIRSLKTWRFIRSNLRLTKFHFHDWSEAPNELGLDLIIVGSDQVWNPQIQGNKLPYLLVDAPRIPAVTYAVSFGVQSMPDQVKTAYAAAINRFRAVSVRESSGIDLIKSFSKINAAHVVDPVALADVSIWDNLSNNPKRSDRTVLTCYFIKEIQTAEITELSEYAKRCNCWVEVFIGAPFIRPNNLQQILSRWGMWTKAAFCPRISFRLTAAPDEFLQSVRNAKWILTDSFHAVMFATVFRKDFRMLLPTTASEHDGFSRISEFIYDCVQGEVFADDIKSAIMSYDTSLPVKYNLLKFRDLREKSLMWLTDAIGEHSSPVIAPILLIGFNRPDFMLAQIEAIRSMHPHKIYVAVDGAREGNDKEFIKCKQTQDAVKTIDWPCEVKTLFRSTNRGCKLGVSEAISWFFKHEEMGIILEDDCRPHPDFLLFATEMLNRYKSDNRIGLISGMNYFNLQTDECVSYHFSNHLDIWGWASWRRVWSKYNVNLEGYEDRIDLVIKQSHLTKFTKKIVRNAVRQCLNNQLNTWDYQFLFLFLAENWLCVVPRRRLVANLGFEAIGSTHTGYNCFSKLWKNAYAMDFPLQHPKDVTPDVKSDYRREKLEAAIFARGLTWIGAKHPSLRPLMNFLFRNTYGLSIT